jgi:hypothetical protein
MPKGAAAGGLPSARQGLWRVNAETSRVGRRDKPLDTLTVADHLGGARPLRRRCGAALNPFTQITTIDADAFVRALQRTLHVNIDEPV